MNYKDIAKFVAQQAEQKGATQVAITIHVQKNTRIDVRDKKVEKTKSGESRQLSLQVYMNGKFSRHTTNRLDIDSLTVFVEQAAQATTFMQADPCRKLPKRDLCPNNEPQLNLFDPFSANITADQQLALAMSAFDTEVLKNESVISAQSTCSVAKTEQYKLLSNGFFGSFKNSYFSISTSVALQADSEKRAEESEYISVLKYKDLPNASSLMEKAYERAVAKVGERKIETGEYNLLIENRVASKFISILLGAMSAAALDQRRSFLEGKQGQLILAPHITIVDDPHIEGAHGSFWYDEEGIAPKKRILIENGVLKNILVDNYYGQKMNLEVNSGAVGNLIFSGKTKSVSDILSQAKRVIQVTAFNGGNSNPATGDFSFGISGMFWEEGQKKNPVSEMVITGNILDLCSQLTCLGNDPYSFAAMKRPSMYFEKVYCSGM